MRLGSCCGIGRPAVFYWRIKHMSLARSGRCHGLLLLSHRSPQDAGCVFWCYFCNSKRHKDCVLWEATGLCHQWEHRKRHFIKNKSVVDFKSVLTAFTMEEIGCSPQQPAWDKAVGYSKSVLTPKCPSSCSEIQWVPKKQYNNLATRGEK